MPQHSTEDVTTSQTIDLLRAVGFDVVTSSVEC